MYIIYLITLATGNIGLVYAHVKGVPKKSCITISRNIHKPSANRVKQEPTK